MAINTATAMAYACLALLPAPRVVQSDDALWQLKATAQAGYGAGSARDHYLACQMASGKSL